MPSACVKVEKQETVSSPESDPIKQMVNLIEKKIRNLEKRKVCLLNATMLTARCERYWRCRCLSDCVMCLSSYFNVRLISRGYDYEK